MVDDTVNAESQAPSDDSAHIPVVEGAEAVEVELVEAEPPVDVDDVAEESTMDEAADFERWRNPKNLDFVHASGSKSAAAALGRWTEEVDRNPQRPRARRNGARDLTKLTIKIEDRGGANVDGAARLERGVEVEEGVCAAWSTWACRTEGRGAAHEPRMGGPPRGSGGRVRVSLRRRISSKPSWVHVRSMCGRRVQRVPETAQILVEQAVLVAPELTAGSEADTEDEWGGDSGCETAHYTGCTARTLVSASTDSGRRNPRQPALTINEPVPVRDPKGKKTASPEPNSDGYTPAVPQHLANAAQIGAGWSRTERVGGVRCTDCSL
ncbi:hypothetical protein C8R47DRAFT_1075898 [Mycena vitilis]|nr:hypothetical protein C8R47DRAFT_1075898 [Mycena vitilis]